MKRAQFLGVKVVSATDVGVQQVEDVYVNYLIDGGPVNTFVGLKPCLNAKAPGITEKVVALGTGVEELRGGFALL